MVNNFLDTLKAQVVDTLVDTLASFGTQNISYYKLPYQTFAINRKHVF